MPVVRRLLVTALLACSVVLVGQLPAHACKCVTAVRQAAEGADDVFTGTVTRSSGKGRRTTYDVAVERIYKGDLATTTVQVSDTRGGTSCAVGVDPADRRYVFFASAQGRALGTDRCQGTTRATARTVGKVQRVLGEGRSPTPPTPPEQPEATFTPVAGEPTSLARLAAPGIALVLVGVLGLVLVAGLGRRRG